MVLNSKFKIPSAIELFKSIPNAKREWKSKTPMQKWCYLYSLGKVPHNFIRLPIFKENINDVHWFGYFGLVYIFAIILLSTFTMCYYQYFGEFQKSLPSTCMATLMTGVSLQMNLI